MRYRIFFLGLLSFFLLGPAVFSVAEEPDDSPFHSLVLLTAEPPELTEERVTAAATAALGDGFAQVEGEPDDDDKKFVAFNTPSSIIVNEGEAYLINAFATPYWEDREAAAEQLDGELAAAVRAHRGWVAVDLLIDEQPPRAELERRYRELGRLIAELADGHATAAYVPATGSVALFDEELRQAIRTGDPAAAIGEPLFSDIVGVGDDDPRMLAAMEQARDRWPEFVAAFAKRTDEDVFLVKVAFTEGDETEHMWVVPDRVSPAGGAGELTNEPRALTDVRMGDTVAFTADRISDWGYATAEQDGEPRGMFTQKIIAEIRAE